MRDVPQRKVVLEVQESKLQAAAARQAADAADAAEAAAAAAEDPGDERRGGVGGFDPPTAQSGVHDDGTRGGTESDESRSARESCGHHKDGDAQ